MRINNLKELVEFVKTHPGVGIKFWKNDVIIEDGETWDSVEIKNDNILEAVNKVVDIYLRARTYIGNEVILIDENGEIEDRFEISVGEYLNLLRDTKISYRYGNYVYQKALREGDTKNIYMIKSKRR